MTSKRLLLASIIGLSLVVIIHVSGVHFSSRTSCNQADTYNSFVLALSWNPGFCRTHETMPECLKMAEGDPQLVYTNHKFTLHGLWPNKNNCGIKYGYCGGFYKERHGFCSLPAMGLNAQTLSKLKQVMPSAYANSCLQRHEWYKHGTCVYPTNANKFFNLAIHLTHQVNQSSFVTHFIKMHRNKEVTRTQLNHAFDYTFGKGAHSRMQILCSGNTLTEIRINLPAKINMNVPLNALITEGNIAKRDTCRSYFSIPTTQTGNH